MRVNEYKELKDFIYEYESGRSIPADNLDRQKFMGIEFKYNDVYYRMCREPLDENEKVIFQTEEQDNMMLFYYIVKRQDTPSQRVMN